MLSPPCSEASLSDWTGDSNVESNPLPLASLRAAQHDAEAGAAAERDSEACDSPESSHSTAVWSEDGAVASPDELFREDMQPVESNPHWPCSNPFLPAANNSPHADSALAAHVSEQGAYQRRDQGCEAEAGQQRARAMASCGAAKQALADHQSSQGPGAWEWQALAGRMATERDLERGSRVEMRMRKPLQARVQHDANSALCSTTTRAVRLPFAAMLNIKPYEEEPCEGRPESRCRV